MYKSLIAVFTLDFCVILEESAYGCFSPNSPFPGKSAPSHPKIICYKDHS